MKAYKRPIQRSIILGSALFITFMCFILSLQSYLSFSKSLYQRYDDRLDNIVNYVHSQIDADDLYNCVQTKEHSEKYDRLQQTLNGMVDEFELFYLYIVFTRDTLMINVISATSQAERDPEKVQQAALLALINMGKINDEVSPEKFHFIEQRIARAKIDGNEKLDLLANIDSDRSYDVDFDLIAADRDLAQDTFDAMKQLTEMDEKVSMAEKIYLNMVAQKLGIEKTEPSI